MSHPSDPTARTLLQVPAVVAGPTEPPHTPMKLQLLAGLVLAPAFVASCANTTETHDAATSAATPKVVFNVEGMT